MRLCPSRFSMATVTGVPPMRQLFRPSAKMVRVTRSSPPSVGSRSMSLSRSSISAGRPVNTAETRALSAPVRISSRDVRSPRTALRASTMIDLPAPVSPLSTLKPGPNAMSADSMTAMFWIFSSESIGSPLYRPMSVLMASRKFRALFSVLQSTNTVSSPAIVPRMPSQFMLSRAAPTAFAMPAWVRMTQVLSA